MNTTRSQQLQEKNALKALKRPSLIGWFLIGGLFSCILIIGFLRTFPSLWFPSPSPTQETGSTGSEPQPEQPAILDIPIKSPTRQLDLNYSTIAQVGGDAPIRIVVTYSEDGKPVKDLKVEFNLISQLDGILDSNEQNTDDNGQAVAVYAPSEDGEHRILVRIGEREIQSVALIQAIPQTAKETGSSQVGELMVTNKDAVALRLENNISTKTAQLPLGTQVHNLNLVVTNENLPFSLIYMEVKIGKEDLPSIDLNNPVLPLGTNLYKIDDNTILTTTIADAVNVMVINDEPEYYLVRLFGYIALEFLSPPTPP